MAQRRRLSLLVDLATPQSFMATMVRVRLRFSMLLPGYYMKSLPPAFASPELLVNQRSLVEAKPEQAVECWVELQFERDRKIYQLKRKCYATRNAEHQISYSQANLFMLGGGR